MESFNTVPDVGSFGQVVSVVNANFQLTYEELQKIGKRAEQSRGLFPSVAALTTAHPTPKVGEWAYVGNSFPVAIYECVTAGVWENSGATWNGESVDLTNYALKADTQDLSAKIGYFTAYNQTGNAVISITAPGFRLTAGGCMRIKMTNAVSTSTVTLNINSSGAKTLYYNGLPASTENSWSAGEVIEVYYDGTRYQSASVQVSQEIKISNTNKPSSCAAVYNAISSEKTSCSTIGDKYIADVAIENSDIYNTTYNYGSTTIFGNTIKVSNIVDCLYIKHYGTGAFNIYKVNVTDKSFALIGTFENIPAGWVRVDFPSRVELLDDEYIGIDNNFYYNDNITDNVHGQFAIVKSNNSLTFNDNIEIGIITCRKNSVGVVELDSDRFADNLGEIITTPNRNYVNFWTTRFNQSNVCFADTSSYIEKAAGCFVKINKVLFSKVLIYRANISNGDCELLKSILITDEFKDGQVVDIKFDNVIELSQDERIAIGGAFWYKDNFGVLDGKQIVVSSGNVSDIHNITYGILPYYDKSDARIYDYNKTKDFISSVSGDIETDEAINAVPRCVNKYYQANQLWGNKYQTQTCMVDGIYWKVHYDSNYTNGTISIYKVNINNSAKTLLKQVLFNENWGEGEIVQIPFEKREFLFKNREYIMILAPIYFKDGLTDGNSITCSLTGSVSTNNSVDIGFFTYCYKQTINTSIIQGLNLSNRFKNKKVAWYGTSIPAGEPHTNNRDVYSYANIAVKRLGGTILNYCVSGSCLISKENTSSTTYNNIRFSDTTAPVNYKNSMLDIIGTLNEPDWFVFDFGANDGAFYKSQFDELDFDNLDFTSTDKKTFLGAYNLVIKSLLQAKPKAKIALVTHFSDDSVNGTHEDYYLNLNKLIRRIGEYWQIPVNDMSHKCGFMYRNGINTLNAYMPIDGLHPGNSLEVVHMLADIHYKFLLNL